MLSTVARKNLSFMFLFIVDFKMTRILLNADHAFSFRTLISDKDETIQVPK